MEEGCSKCLYKMLGMELENKGKSQKMLHYRTDDIMEVEIRENKQMWSWPNESGVALWSMRSPKNKS